MWKEHSVSFLIQCTNIILMSTNEYLSVQYLTKEAYIYVLSPYLPYYIWRTRHTNMYFFSCLLVQWVNMAILCKYKWLPDFNRVSVYQCLNSGQQEILQYWIWKIPKANEVNCFHWDIDLVKLARLHNWVNSHKFAVCKYHNRPQGNCCGYVLTCVMSRESGMLVCLQFLCHV